MESILIVDDEKLIRWSLAQELSRNNYQTMTAMNVKEALRVMRESLPDAVILDLRLPDGNGIDALKAIKEIHPDTVVVMLTAEDKSSMAVQAMKLGAFDYLTKPVHLDELILVISNAMESVRLKKEVQLLNRHHQMRQKKINIIAESKGMKTVMEFIQKVGPTKSTVLITGESGTGKEVIANAIHQSSERKDRLMLSINCGAITESLIESELFGHERGAFTDAVQQHKGLFETAEGGTVFLDEIGDLTPRLQVKLLRVLEEKKFQRVGGTQDIFSDVRIIAATNQLLEKKIEVHQFRLDLFYRLNVASILLPPLRERKEDIIPIAEHFLDHFNRAFHKSFKGFTDETKQAFLRYDWPGNIRELRNTIERAMILDDGEYIFSHAIEIGHLHHLSVHERDISEGTAERSLQSVERETILKALEKTKFNQVQAARILNISRDTLRYRMKKFGLNQKHEEIV